MNFTNKENLHFYGNHPGRLPVFMISGPAGVGKTTLANLMLTSLSEVIPTPLGLRQSILSFASPIKQCALEYFGWDGVKNEKGRELLRKLGTETGREYNKDLWAEKLVSKIIVEDIQFTHNAVFIDDWRFPNEHEVLNRQSILYVITIRILNRPGVTQADHISEISLANNDEYDIRVSNSGTIEELREIGKLILQKYYGGL